MNHNTLNIPRLSAVVLGLSLCFAPVLPAAAAATPDPYADAIDDTTAGMIMMPEAALGAPDGQAATVNGMGDHQFVLDMGVNEEGTGALVVHYLGMTTAVASAVAFLDANHQVLATQALPLADLTAGPHQRTVPYDPALPPYRYVRFSTTMGQYSIDAVVATTYRPDSDSDGLPDTWEDGYGLNPRSPTGTDGATGDLDGDGLTNAEEYAAGTNPTKADTDGDGLPDGWEVDHGLDPRSPTGSNGAAGDPDGDGFDNEDEYAAGTDPLNGDNHPANDQTQHRILLPSITT